MKNRIASKYIQAIVVNHNTSRYTELMLRSLLTRHPDTLDCSVTILDNNSRDDTTELAAYASAEDILLLPSGFPLATAFNSHGEILRRFVLEHPDCVYYLFLDSDVCFIESDTISTMIQELGQVPSAFGIAPRLSSDGEIEISRELWDLVYNSRLHPCCALVRNTAIFRRVAEVVGFSCAKYLWADREEYLDTFQLMSRVMKSHGLHHIRSSKLVLHFFSVSYDCEPPGAMEFKARLRDGLLREFRSRAGG